MKQRFRRFLAWVLRKTADPPPRQDQTIERMGKRLEDFYQREAMQRSTYMEMVGDLVEARQMAGAGPWRVAPSVVAATDRLIAEAQKNYGQPQPLRESLPLLAAGGGLRDLDFLMANGDWHRISSMSWLEFSRWGIQQLILICRLYYIKHPWVRRGVNLSASYVFGQGVELSSPDPDANEQLKRFREANKVTLGQIALTEQEKQKSYDGNLFWCLFPDTQNTGEVAVRLIDATEITEIVSNPNDSLQPWFYKREWISRTYDTATGSWSNTTLKRWHPALNYEPPDKPPMIGDAEVQWDAPVYHRKVGHVAQWSFGCPRVFPALDWAKAGSRHLNGCANVTQALSEVAIQYITKGGQASITALERKLRGPSSDLRDLEEPISGGALLTGPGTQVNVLKTRGAGTDPSEVKEYRNMAACCLDVPPTWLGDMETSNLATAQTLDRPTELGFELRREEWQEDLATMGVYSLRISAGAPSGRLREALDKREKKKYEIREAAHVIHNGHWRHEASKVRQPGVIEVVCNFPAIREGNIKDLVAATVEAMTLGTQTVQGIDEKTGVRQLLDVLGIDDADRITEEMYPAAEYEIDRTKEPPPEPVAPPAGKPGVPAASVREVVRQAIRNVNRALAEKQDPVNGAPAIRVHPVDETSH
jgi:hypothetical protein